MKEAKTEAEKVIADYRAEVQAEFDTKSSKVGCLHQFSRFLNIQHNRLREAVDHPAANWRLLPMQTSPNLSMS